MKIFILSCENINQRSINQLHKKIFSLFSNFWPNFGKTLAKEVEFVTLPGLLVNRNIIK